ncbi:MAG: hypothetical protein V1659_01415 [Candidatus Woesearchaeota archaeon]
MGKTKEILTNWRVMLLIVCVILSVIVIRPNPYAEGVTIKFVKVNSTASLAGISNPAAESMAMSREVILFINNLPVKNEIDYYSIMDSMPANTSIVMKSTKRVYSFRLPENKDIGMSVYNAPKSNIMQGLDLVGGARVILKPVDGQNYTKDQLQLVVNNIEERLNIYGLRDVKVKTTSSFTENDYIIVEMAGASKEEVESLIEQEGKFEAKIGDIVVFEGGKSHIPFVCNSPQCSGVSLRTPCEQLAENDWVCSFEFQITLSEEAADNFFKEVSQLQDVGGHLSKNISFLIDNELVSSLQIDSSFKDAEKSTATITGAEHGNSKLDAFNNAIKEMNRMQSVLTTGNLPIKLEKEEDVFISPVLGERFLKNAALIGILSLITVSSVIMIRYRKLKYTLPVIATLASELVIILGIATLIRWNIDLPAIAGIIIAIGTGVDNLIVILDEQKIKGDEVSDKKKKFKNAFFIIMGSYLTLSVSMLFLFFAGAGLLKGFALTTLIGSTSGVLIARPAFAKIVEILTKDEKEED